MNDPEFWLPTQRQSPSLRLRLGEILLKAGLLTSDQLEDCLAVQAQMPPTAPRRRLGDIAVSRGYVSEVQIALAIAGRLDIPVVDLTTMVVPRELLVRIPRSVAVRCGAVAYAEAGDRLWVAMVDPTNVVMVDDVRLYTGVRTVEVAVAPAAQIDALLNRAWVLGEDATAAVSALEDNQPSPDGEDLATAVVRAEEAPIVRLANVILSNAARARASDIHLEPQAGDLRVRYRVDGLLREVMTVPANASSALISRIKIMSALDIAERRRPQDGRARFEVNERSVDARVSTLPSMHGEKLVLRLLETEQDVQPLERSGMSARQLEIVRGQLVAPQGLVLITGPTGSGKTSTLYSAIDEVRSPDRNIVTLEDPVEIQLPGITQMQVNERAGVTFARGLRAILRQDPDVILVGEIRDAETAELAMQAALTGHLVLATLHTNDAPSALTRLVDIGVDAALIASSLALVVAQRLVRVPCTQCATAYEPSRRALEHFGIASEAREAARFLRGAGCGECGDTGYLGRTGVFEVLPVTSQLRAVLLETPSEGPVRQAARAAGVPSLRSEALDRALRGATTLDEVSRATQPDSTEARACRACARPLADDMLACPWCTADADHDRCGHCGRRMGLDWRMCPWCRTSATRADSVVAGLPSVLHAAPHPSAGLAAS